MGSSLLCRCCCLFCPDSTLESFSLTIIYLRFDKTILNNNVVSVYVCVRMCVWAQNTIVRSVDGYDDVLDHPNSVFCIKLILITINFGDDFDLKKRLLLQPLLLVSDFLHFFVVVVFILNSDLFFLALFLLML